MPELPDIAAYLSALETRIVGQPLERVRLDNAFLLRTVQPPIETVEGPTVHSLHRIGKRIAVESDNGIWMVLHLMIAGRLHWRPVGAKLGGRNKLAALRLSPRFACTHRDWSQASRLAASISR